MRCRLLVRTPEEYGVLEFRASLLLLMCTQGVHRVTYGSAQSSGAQAKRAGLSLNYLALVGVSYFMSIAQA